MRRELRLRLSAILAVVALVVIAIGVPFILIRAAGWPLPASMPDWMQVRTALRQGDIPGQTVVKALAAVVWLIWLQVMWAIAWETIVNVPRLTSGRRPRPAPLVASPLGVGAARLVALIMSIGLTVGSMPSAATALPATNREVPSATVSVRSEPFAPVSGTPTTAARREMKAWHVAKGDSLWRIAEVALGEGDRSSEILELNPSIHSARDLRAGHVLRLPADAAVPDDRWPEQVSLSDEDVPASDSSALTYLSPTHIVIELGDTLWGLSEKRLSQIDDDVTPRETLDQVNAVIAANPDVVEDPNLLFPGEVFAFPAVGTLPAPLPPPLVQNAPAVDEVPDVVPVPAAPEAQPVVPDPIPSTVPIPAPAVSNPAPDPATEPATDADDTVTSVEGSHYAAPWVAGISGATILASGLLLTYRRRLALRAARGARAYRASRPDDPSTLRAIVCAADVGLLRWANHELAELFAALKPGVVVGMPVAVELSESHGIEVLWTAANASALHPWEATDGGWSWRLLYDADLPVPAGDQPAVLPALVTVGTRDGNQLLLNLEALGSIAVDAEPETADSFVRSIIVEFAANDVLTDAYLHCAGIPMEGISHFGRVRLCDEATALSLLEAASLVGEQFLETHGMSTVFESRIGGDAVGRESTVVVARMKGIEVEQFAGSARPGSGTCVVLAGGSTCVDASVVIDATGQACLQPLGLRFVPSLLPTVTMQSISDLLDEVSEPFIDSEEAPIDEPPADVISASIDADSETDLGVDDDWALPEPAVLVRVIGVPEVVGYPQLGRIETSIVAYLACHGGKRTDDQIINAVWNGRLVEPKTLWNKISKIRSVLGPELVPPRLPNSAAVILADGVVTDLMQIRTLSDRAAEVSAAEAVALLLRGLGLIAGIPFDSSEFDWPHETQQHAAACELIESAALRCSSIALDLGDVPSARTAVLQGLRALPLNEPMYRERMRVESAAGNPDGVRRSLSELCHALDARSDGGLRLQPEPATIRLAEGLR